MDRMNKARRLVAAGLTLAATAAADPVPYDWQVESSLSYLHGDYGTGENTDLIYWPVTAQRNFSRGSLAVTIPYLLIDTEGGATVVDGDVVAEGSPSGGTAAGLGDVMLKGRYNWKDQQDAWPFIDLVARFKLPTADEQDGLGTGEADAGFAVEMARRFAGEWLGFLDLGYTFIGDPPDMDYDNRLTFNTGLGRQLTPQWMAAAFYEVRTAISPDSADAHTFSLLFQSRLAPPLAVYAMVDMGLTEGAADVGLTVGGSYRF